MKSVFIVISKRVWGDDYGTAVALGSYSEPLEGSNKHYKNINYPAFKTKESAEAYIEKVKATSSGWNDEVTVIEVPLFN